MRPSEKTTTINRATVNRGSFIGRTSAERLRRTYPQLTGRPKYRRSGAIGSCVTPIRKNIHLFRLGRSGGRQQPGRERAGPPTSVDDLADPGLGLVGEAEEAEVAQVGWFEWSLVEDDVVEGDGHGVSGQGELEPVPGVGQERRAGGASATVGLDGRVVGA